MAKGPRNYVTFKSSNVMKHIENAIEFALQEVRAERYETTHLKEGERFDREHMHKYKTLCIIETILEEALNECTNI